MYSQIVLSDDLSIFELQPHRLACHQHGRDGTLQQLRIEFCRTFERCKQPPQALGFVFFVADGVVLLLCQPADHTSGSVLVERLGVQDLVQFSLRGAVRCKLFFRLCDALRLLCQPAEQMYDLLLDLRRRQFGADPLERFLCRRPLWQALLGLTLFSGCLE